MKVKTKSNFWLDMGILLAFVLIMFTGIVLWLVLPEGRGSSIALFWGLTKSVWLDIHVWSGVVMFLGAGAHILIHWRWIICVGKRYFQKLAKQARINFTLNTMIFIGFLLANISGLVIWLLLPQGGYQGGRNPAFQMSFLGLEREIWGDWHLWSGLILIAILVVHIINHRQWIFCMVKRYTKRLIENQSMKKSNEPAGLECPL